MIKRLLLLALLAPSAAIAQHASFKEMLAIPTPSVALACKVIPPPTRKLPSSALSYEISYVTLRPGAADGITQMDRHQDFTIVWDSAGRLLMFGGTHPPTETDTLAASFAMIAVEGDTMAGLWIIVTDSARSVDMWVDDKRNALALAAHFWTRRCTGS